MFLRWLTFKTQDPVSRTSRRAASQHGRVGVHWDFPDTQGPGGVGAAQLARSVTAFRRGHRSQSTYFCKTA